MLPEGRGWGVVRIIGQPREGASSSPYPSVTALRGWSILVGRSRDTGLASFRTQLDQSWFDNVHSEASGVHGFTYAILSARELVLFLVGPPTASMPDANIAFAWDGRDVTLVGPGHELVPVRSGGQAFVPTTDTTTEIPINYKGPFGCLEVQTRMWNPPKTLFMRLEQFSPLRIPLSRYTVWREPSHGAYSNYSDDPRTLERMSSAAFCWMFALRAVFEDSGWAETFHRLDTSNHIAVLGFETNNPIHDDHDGRGPHFHIGLKSAHKDRERNPAFYMNTDDGSVSQTVYSTQGVELAASGLFGVVRLGSALAIGPLVRLKSPRTGMFLYVRESEQGTGQGVFQTRDDDASDNVTWVMVATAAGNAFALCNVRSGCFAHVDSQRAVGELSQSSSWAGGSQWTVAPASHGCWSLASVTSKQYMYSFFRQHALPVGQFGANDDGSEWAIEYRTGEKTGWAATASALPPSYSLAVVRLAEFEATLTVTRNGDAWATTAIRRTCIGDRQGRVDVETRRVTGAGLECQSIEFDRVTGKQIQDH
jgi:hypothetical protein